MKRISRKIRKRFSLSSNERRDSMREIYGGVTQARQLPIPQIQNENSHAYIFSPNNRNTRGDIRVRSISEPSSDLTNEQSENHDYSVLDDEDDNDAFDDPQSNQSGELAAQHNGTLGESSLLTGVEPIQLCPASPVLWEFEKLARQGWYWGPMTREQAERRLSDAPEASFLVRDSSDDRYILSLSFRSHHRTLHTRIAHSGMKFSFYEDNPKQAYTSVVELIENSMRDTNEQGVFCYSRSRQPFAPTFPVRLLHPVSRFTEVRPLQDLCRFVIRRAARVDHIQTLPLPKPIKEYLNHSYF